VAHLGKAALGLALGLLLQACASAPPSAEALAANDPYEQTNRQTLVLNGKIDRYIVVPTVAVYFVLVPNGGRRGVHNFLGNLTKPATLVDDLLQGEVTRGSQTLARFLINSTLGFGGFFDPATKMGIPNHGEDFGQTLAVWGAGEGPYVMLPLFGPSDARDAVGLGVDAAIDPTNFVPMKQHLWWAGAREYFTLLDVKSQTYETVQGIQRSSVDYYASLRSFYRQLRDNEIRNGRPATSQNLPDF
jgi:phospholipid-binding lipoprotein MlaA